MRRHAWPLFALVLLAVAVAICVLRFDVTGDITHFLPEDTDPGDLEISRTLARSGLGKGMILLVDAGPGELENEERTARVIATTSRLAAALARTDGIEWVNAGVSEDQQAAFYELFFAARFGFLSSAPERDLAPRLTDEGLAASAAEVRAQLAGPLGGMLARTIGADPLMAFAGHLRRLKKVQPAAIDVEESVFVARGADGQSPPRGVIFTATVASPFAAATQAALLERIHAEFAEITADQPGMKLELSGVNLFAIAGEKSMRADVQRITVISLVGTVLLFLLCFRSPRYFLVLFVPVGFGVAGGLAACLLTFGAVHGMTLAFGATLIGVSVDYTVHFLQHQVLEPDDDGPRATLRHVWVGIMLGGATTIIGFIGMAWTSTPGMRQIAVFGAVGIAFALLATYAILPLLVPRRPKVPKGLAAARDALTRGFAALTRHRRALLVIPITAIALAAIALPRMTWDDDPTSLISSDESLVENDERIRNVVSTADPGLFVVARGASWEQALIANDRAAGALEQAVAAGELAEFQSLHDILWSADLQRRNHAQLRGSPDLADRQERAFASAGFKASAFAPFRAALEAPPAPVTAADLADGPLRLLLRGFYAEGDDVLLVLTRLRGVTDVAALDARLEALDTDDVVLFDQAAYLASSYGGFRASVLEVVVASLIAVLLLVFVRYRDWRLSLAAFIPAVLAATTALAVLSLAGVTLNLLHVLGLMLVLSIGVDYGVFVVEAARRRGDVGVAMLGTGVSCATTILSFGLLAMSANPALRALGVIAATGCLLALILAPMALILVGRETTKP